MRYMCIDDRWQPSASDRSDKSDESDRSDRSDQYGGLTLSKLFNLHKFLNLLRAG